MLFLNIKKEIETSVLHVCIICPLSDHIFHSVVSSERGAPTLSYPPPASRLDPTAQHPGDSPQPQVTVVQAHSQTQPESYWVYSVLTSLFCIWPIGLGALILSVISRASDKFIQGKIFFGPSVNYWKMITGDMQNF